MRLNSAVSSASSAQNNKKITQGRFRSVFLLFLPLFFGTACRTVPTRNHRTDEHRQIKEKSQSRENPQDHRGAGAGKELPATDLLSKRFYRCESGQIFEAGYYRETEVKKSRVILRDMKSGGRSFVLYRAVSASGARYTDDRNREWWTKRKEALWQRGNPAEEKRQTVCRESPGPLPQN